jgi:hypothetical protein
MGFSKKDYSPEVAIVINHPYYPETPFVFHFQKLMPKGADDALNALINLKEDERKEGYRSAWLNIVSELATKAPEGFDDFPIDERPLPERMREYFDDAEKPEFASIIFRAWNEYQAAAIPAARLKSLSDYGAGNSQSTRATEEAKS